MEVSSQLHDPAALPQGKEPLATIALEVEWAQSRSGRGGEEKNSQPPPGLEPPIIQPVAEPYTTELSQLLRAKLFVVRIITVIHYINK
jgi:hypothetical protein